MMHPLESDGVSAQFFSLLSKENKKDMQSCRVRCPLTVLFEQGFAKAAFATETTRPGEPIGELKRKPGKEVDLTELFQQFTRNTIDGDIVAVLLHAAPRTPEMNLVRFMDRSDLRNFLFHEIEKPRSLLQKFVKPKGVSNTLVHAVWSPLMVLAEGRRNAHSLKDRHLPAAVRGTTFEAASADTTEVVVAQAVVREITQVCKTVAEHFEKTDRLVLNRLAAFFKVDEQNRLQLLFSTSIRVQDSATGRNNAPISLAVAIKTPSKAGGAKPDASTRHAEEDAFLALTDGREGSFRMSIPSLPDTSSLLLQSVHRAVSRANRLSPPRVRALSPTSSRVVSPRTPSPQMARSTSPNLQRAVVQPPTALVSPTRNSGTSPRRQRLDESKRQQQAASPSAVPRAGRELKLTPGAALPQPRALLRYQHLLPNSALNYEAASRRAEMGLSEHDVRLEWETFLADQQRDLDRLRTLEEAKKDALALQNAGGNGDGQPRASRDAVVPPVRSHTVFAGQAKVASPSAAASHIARAERATTAPRATRSTCAHRSRRTSRTSWPTGARPTQHRAASQSAMTRKTWRTVGSRVRSGWS
jgi:hypothetical protein